MTEIEGVSLGKRHPLLHVARANRSAAAGCEIIPERLSEARMVDLLGMFRRRPAKRNAPGFARSRADITSVRDTIGGVLTSPVRDAPPTAREAPLPKPQPPRGAERPKPRKGNGAATGFRSAQRPGYLAVHSVEKSFGTRQVVRGVSIYVRRGEAVGLLGPNGAGKTTVFYMITGLIKADRGAIELDGHDVTKLPMYQRARLGIGYLPQEASVFRKLSVEDNILAVLEMSNISRAERHTKLEKLIGEFRLQHVRKSNGDVVSGGERRRTEIARALAVDPKFILLDEPFAGVDPIAVEDIQSVVAKMKYKNIGILITDHNVNETLSICDRAYLLIDGKIFKHGTAEQLADDEQVRRLYLGTNFELKRKDWIIDMARKGKEGITSEEVIDVLPEEIHRFICEDSRPFL